MKRSKKRNELTLRVSYSTLHIVSGAFLSFLALRNEPRAFSTLGKCFTELCLQPRSSSFCNYISDPMIKSSFDDCKQGKPEFYLLEGKKSLLDYERKIISHTRKMTQKWSLEWKITSTNFCGFKSLCVVFNFNSHSSSIFVIISLSHKPWGGLSTTLQNLL